MNPRLSLLLIACACLSACNEPAPAPPSAPPAPQAQAKPIVSDWQTEVSPEQIRAAVSSIGTEKQMSAAEADAALVLPSWGLWSDMSQDQARALYEKIPLDLGLKYVYGSGKNELVVFTDPHNQNDRRLLGILQANAASMDATLYVFPLPSDPPVSNVDRILCTANPEQAWKDWANQIAAPKKELGSLFTSRLDPQEEEKRWASWENKHPETLGCGDPQRSARIDALASELGVAFTPTVVFAHGRAWPGQFPEMQDIRDTWEYVGNRLHFGPQTAKSR